MVSDSTASTSSDLGSAIDKIIESTIGPDIMNGKNTLSNVVKSKFLPSKVSVQLLLLSLMFLPHIMQIVGNTLCMYIASMFLYLHMYMILS